MPEGLNGFLIGHMALEGWFIAEKKWMKLVMN